MIGEPILVMLVEDNVDHAELVIRTLEEHKIANRVKHFLDGQSALDYLFHRGEFESATDIGLPHVILLDLRLPRVDGIDVLRAIKEDDNLKSNLLFLQIHWRMAVTGYNSILAYIT